MEPDGDDKKYIQYLFRFGVFFGFALGFGTFTFMLLNWFITDVNNESSYFAKLIGTMLIFLLIIFYFIQSGPDLISTLYQLSKEVDTSITRVESDLQGYILIGLGIINLVLVIIFILTLQSFLHGMTTLTA